MANSAFNHEPSFTIPGATTDNAVVIFNGTSGGGIDNSTVIVDSGGNGRIGIAADVDLLALASGALTVNGTIGSGAITSTGVVTATGFTIGSAAIDEAELEILDGATVTTTELNLLDALDRGSILYGNPSGVTTVLGQGCPDQVLTSDGTDISWEDVATGAGTGPLRMSDGSASAPAYSWTSNTNMGFFRASGSVIGIASCGNEYFRIGCGGRFFIKDSTSGDMSYGITINQLTTDNQVLAFKSSDVDHCDGFTEADTYGFFKKAIVGCGGMSIVGISKDQNYALELTGYVTGEAGSRSSAAKAHVHLNSGLLVSGNACDTAANKNVVAVRPAGHGSVMFVTSNGDIYLDGTSNDSAFDEYCDVSLLTTYRTVLMPSESDFRNRFGDFIEENAKVLSDTGVIEFNDDGHHFFSVKGLNGLMIDSIRQLHGRVEGLESQFKALGEGK